MERCGECEAWALLVVTTCVVAGALAGLGHWPVGAVAGSAASGPTQYGYEVVHVYPHDRGAFTQGLLYRDGVSTRAPD